MLEDLESTDIFAGRFVGNFGGPLRCSLGAIIAQYVYSPSIYALDEEIVG
jgi:hypothetical protein